MSPTPQHILSDSPTSIRWPFADDDTCSIILPPPSTLRGSQPHRRSQTATDLPPLFSQTPSSSPTRSSTFLPFLRSARDRSISPERVSAQEAAEYQVATPPEETPSRLKASKVEKLASWFDGASEPVKLSIVSSSSIEQLSPPPASDSMETFFSASSDSVDNLTKRPQKLHKRPTMPAHQSTQSLNRFSFFRKTPQTQAKIDPANENDELAQFDMHSSLFPTGAPTDFSPAAYKNLQLNAEGTIRRLQDAYQDNLEVLKNTKSAKNVQADDLDAAQTQNEHLSLQLLEMAAKAAEQERTISALRVDLAAAKTIRMVSYHNERAPAEFLTERRRQNRGSDGSIFNGSEADSEASSASSVFSETGSVGLESPGTSIAASPMLKSAHCFRLPREQTTAVPRYEPNPMSECQRCHGIKSNEAWAVVGVMKAESVVLKSRIEELEGAQSAALDFLSGLGCPSST